MNWTKSSHLFLRSSNRSLVSQFGGSNSSCSSALSKDVQSPMRVCPESASPFNYSAARHLHSVKGAAIVARNVFGRYAMPPEIGGNFSRLKVVKHGAEAISYRFQHGAAANDSRLSRNFLAELWVLDKKAEKSAKKRLQNNKYRGLRVEDRCFSQSSDHDGTVVLEQPPPSQPLSGYLKPTSPEEAQVAPLLARSNLLITRDIEWANLMLGFEQENRYAVVDVCYPQAPVGLIREQSNLLARQFLRTRRPFVALVSDAMANELFREIGVVHRRWHLWRRIYDLYLGNKQFAVVENPGLWNWTFTLKDIDDQVLAQIDRDWRGFGFEIFTDAGQYVIRFGSQDINRSSPGTANRCNDRVAAAAAAITVDRLLAVFTCSTKMASDFTAKTELSPHSYGGYSTSLSFGTPPQTLSFVVDTTSSFVWFPCTTHYFCEHCVFPSPTSRIPSFIPVLSSSSKIVGCRNPKCSRIHGRRWRSEQCENCGYNAGGRRSRYCSQICPPYLILYGSGTTGGVALSETLRFRNLTIPNFLIGCSVFSSRQPAGIAGLGRGRSSLVSQLGLARFSYCLRVDSVYYYLGEGRVDE
ncbi:unnamed protein product [Linum tenue]|uniref:Peptidase A1 domain-containing protein n=2 Tax=Magnoliopsida TaxID=3398 RepID=A0AAV0M4K7_9ROSI|nr:unnamed protein product [Linum tenue]